MYKKNNQILLEYFIELKRYKKSVIHTLKRNYDWENITGFCKPAKKIVIVNYFSNGTRSNRCEFSHKWVATLAA